SPLGVSAVVSGPDLGVATATCGSFVDRGPMSGVSRPDRGPANRPDADPLIRLPLAPGPTGSAPRSIDWLSRGPAGGTDPLRRNDPDVCPPAPTTRSRNSGVLCSGANDPLFDRPTRMFEASPSSPSR